MEFQVKEKLVAFQAALVEKDPKMPELLGEVHKVLRQYPENVTLLKDEELRDILSGLQTARGIVLQSSAKGVAKAKTEAKKLAGSAKTADLMARLKKLAETPDEGESDGNNSSDI